MALVKCSECGKEVSDKAEFCPNCGFPIKQNLMPTIPKNLNVGKAVDGELLPVTLQGTRPKDFSILCHTYGISLIDDKEQITTIHFAQIIKIYYTNKTELKNKSFLGRALLGGVLFGQTGAVLGGMSAVKQDNDDTPCIVLEYWDINTKTQTVAIFHACATITTLVPIEKVKKMMSDFVYNCEQQMRLVAFNISTSNENVDISTEIKRKRQELSESVLPMKIFLGICLLIFFISIFIVAVF